MAGSIILYSYHKDWSLIRIHCYKHILHILSQNYVKYNAEAQISFHRKS